MFADVLAFGIGAITQFRMVELFCLYTGLCIIFSYVYCITFFSAGMVYSGLREENNRHCFLFVKVKSKEESKCKYLYLVKKGEFRDQGNKRKKE